MAATIDDQVYLERFHQLRGDTPLLRAQYVVTMDTAYPTGGEAVDFTAGGEFGSVLSVSVDNVDVTDGVVGYMASWDLSASKFIINEALAADDSGSVNAPFPEAGVDDASLANISITCTVIGTPA